MTASRTSVDRLEATGWRGVWSLPRARLWLIMSAIGSWLPLLGMPARNWLDFSSFYAAGALAFHPQVISLTAVEAYQAANGLPNTPFLYPPGLAIAYVPFAALPYELAAALHVAVQALALVAAALLASRVYTIPVRWTLLGAVAWAPAAAGVVSGENSAVLLLLTVVATWALARGSGAFGLAGLAMGLLAYRPHLGLPLTGLALWRTAWAAAVIAAAVLAVHYGLGFIATGGQLDWPIRWLATVADETANDFQSVGWQSISLPGNLGRISIGGSTLGSPLGPALLGYLVGIVLIAWSLVPLRHWDAPRAVALTCALALFAGPRGWFYDATLLLPAIAILARDGAQRGWPWQYRWLLAAAYGIALGWPIGGIVGLTPVMLVVLVAPFVLLGRGPFRGFAPTAA